MKKGKMTQVEKYCVDNMAKEGESSQDIAEFLDRPVALVEKYMPELPAEEELKKRPSTKINKTQFIRETAAKKEKAVSIMTGQESSRSEQTRSSRVGRDKVIKKYQKVIHKIKDED